MITGIRIIMFQINNVLGRHNIFLIKLIKNLYYIRDKGYVYTKKIYSWGVFYFKDGIQISEGAYNYETSEGYIQNQLMLRR